MSHDRLPNRRDALRLLACAVTAGAWPRPCEAAEWPRSGLGLVIYALGIQRRKLKAEDPSQDLFEPFRFLDHCHALGAGGIQVPLGTLEPAACERLRARAEAYGMFVEGIAAPPFADAEVERFTAEVEMAARVGAKAVRTVVMPSRRYERFRSPEEFDRYAERGRRALKRARPIVERHRVRLAVENHKDQRLDERLALLEGLNCPMIGACVDTGNSFALLEDPVAVVEGLAPYAFSVHLKDQAVQEYEDGFLFADVPLGDGFLDLERMVRVLRDAQPDVCFSLETITRDPLRVPCLLEGYWTTFTEVPGSDLARTLRTVRAHAAAELTAVGALPIDEQVALERATVAKSLEYARRELGIRPG